MFNLVAERITPVVENLAALGVAADTPVVFVVFRHQIVVARQDVFEIEHLEPRMVELGGRSFNNRDGVVIGEGLS